jgi:hypothetical protein
MLFERITGNLQKIYGRDVDYIETVYVPAIDRELTVLAREIGHAITGFSYGITTPQKIHEVLSRYVC